MINAQAFEVLSALFLMLLGGNLWFIRRVLGQIDRIPDIEKAIAMHHGITDARLKSSEEKLTELSAQAKDVPVLKAEVSFLKYVISGLKTASPGQLDVRNN